MAERFVHFSSYEIAEIKSVRQDATKRHGGLYKPGGFWISVEGGQEPWDWSNWSASEGFRAVHLQRAYEITLASDNTVLRLSMPEELIRFDDDFCLEGTAYGMHSIDWPKVAERHQGIIISPYQWSLRLGDLDWYYPWDCASGCVWDARAIASFEEIDAAQFAPKRDEDAA